MKKIKSLQIDDLHQGELISWEDGVIRQINENWFEQNNCRWNIKYVIKITFEG